MNIEEGKGGDVLPRILYKDPLQFTIPGYSCIATYLGTLVLQNEFLSWKGFPLLGGTPLHVPHKARSHGVCLVVISTTY